MLTAKVFMKLAIDLYSRKPSNTSNNNNNNNNARP